MSDGGSAAPSPVYGDQGAAPYGSSPAGGAYPGAPLSRGRVANLCGAQLSRQHPYGNLEVQCPDGLASAPGSATRCVAVFDRRSYGMTATVRSYDSARGDAQLDCVVDNP